MPEKLREMPSEPAISGWRVAFYAFQIRLRFIVIILMLALLASAWPWLARMWDSVLNRWSPFVPDSTVTAGTEYFCPMDPGVISVWPAICPICHMDLISRRKGEAQILPSGVVARMQIAPYRISLAGVRTVRAKPRTDYVEEAIDQTSGQEKERLRRQISQSSTEGEVLIPGTALVHWGNEQVVYVESMPGTFDGVSVRVVGREGDLIVVSGGLKPHQNVVAIGTLLIDAETRLNPHLATQYFGASAQTTAAPRAAPKVLAKPTPKALDAAQQLVIDTQRVCPVTKAKLGSMGVPILVDVKGKQVAICCEGCRGRLLANADKYLEWLKQYAERTASQLPPSPTEQKSSSPAPSQDVEARPARAQ